MKVNELVETLGLEILTQGGNLEREVKGCYIGDLLSWVMGKAEAQNAWITIMSNINIVAVAALTDVSCVILCEGVTPEESVIKKANEEEIVILKGKKTAYELANELSGVV